MRNYKVSFVANFLEAIVLAGTTRPLWPPKVPNLAKNEAQNMMIGNNVEIMV